MWAGRQTFKPYSSYLALCQEIICSYDDCIQVYTDAALVNSGLVGFGVHFVSNIPLPFSKDNSFRLNNGISIYKAEMFAINFALKRFASTQLNVPLVLFTDSLSSVRSLISGRSVTNNNLVLDTLELISGVFRGRPLGDGPPFGAEGNFFQGKFL